MAGIKSIEKLRKFAENAVYKDNYIVGSTFDLNRIADEIEAEIAERYMDLPVDADGVPIRVGDVVEFGEYRNMGIAKAVNERMVIAMRIDEICTNYAKYGLLWDADSCRHVKPRTIEDVLNELVEAVRYERVCDKRLSETSIADFAAEIRELLEVSE